MTPKISIITPSYNQAQYLKQTLDSVLSQNYRNLEYIVIDGVSKDGSVDILKKYEKQINFWVSEPDNGQSHAINKGIKKATGEIINWLNSDDYYEDNALVKVAEAFERENARVVIGKSRLFKEGKTIGYSGGTDVYPGNLTKTIGWARVDQPGTFFREETWDKVGLLNEQLHYTMDREWWMRYLYLFGLGEIVAINDVLVNFRLHDNSKTVSSNEKFQVEHDTIFYILSTLSRNKIIPKMLADNLEVDLSIDSEIRNWTDPQIIEGSINYYLLKRADEFYYQGENGKCRDFLKCIDKRFLAKEDVALFNRIAFRSKLPGFIITFFRTK